MEAWELYRRLRRPGIHITLGPLSLRLECAAGSLHWRRHFNGTDNDGLAAISNAEHEQRLMKNERNDRGR